MRTVVLVTGPEPGPVASRELAQTVQAAGAWGIAFEAPTAGCASLSVHAVANAADSLRVGAWVSPSSPLVAAEQLTTLDLLTGGRVFGLTTSAERAQEIEQIALFGARLADPEQSTQPSSAGRVKVPPPVQTLLPVLVLRDRVLSYPLLDAGPDAGWAVIAWSVQDLVSLRGREALKVSIRQTRRSAQASR